MDSDEFDGDDIADEDFLVATTQATTPPRPSSTHNLNQNLFQPDARSLSDAISRPPHLPVS